MKNLQLIESALLEDGLFIREPLSQPYSTKARSIVINHLRQTHGEVMISDQELLDMYLESQTFDELYDDSTDYYSYAYHSYL